jgi:hypothetical protein
MAQRIANRIGAIARGDLAIDVLDVSLDRALAAAERGGHLAVALPHGEEAQYRHLARGHPCGLLRHGRTMTQRGAAGHQRLRALEVRPHPVQTGGNTAAHADRAPRRTRRMGGADTRDPQRVLQGGHESGDAGHRVTAAPGARPRPRSHAVTHRRHGWPPSVAPRSILAASLPS